MRVLAKLLAVVSALLLPLALAGVWAERAVTDTDGYVATVGPLAGDADVQEAVADRLAARVVAAVGIGSGQDPAGPASDAVGDLVAAGARQVVAGAAFGEAWRSANRAAHEAFDAAVADGRSRPVELRLDRLVQPVLDRLSERGLPVPQEVDTGLTVELATAADVERVRPVYRFLEVAGPVLPFAWAGVLLLALLLPGRRATLGLAAAASAVTTAALWLLVRSAGDLAATRLPEVDRDLARAAYDALTTDLRTWSLVALGASVVVLVVALLLPGGRRAR